MCVVHVKLFILVRIIIQIIIIDGGWVLIIQEFPCVSLF